MPKTGAGLQQRFTFLNSCRAQAMGKHSASSPQLSIAIVSTCKSLQHSQSSARGFGNTPQNMQNTDNPQHLICVVRTAAHLLAKLESLCKVINRSLLRASHTCPPCNTFMTCPSATAGKTSRLLFRATCLACRYRPATSSLLLTCACTTAQCQCSHKYKHPKDT